jgi:hypothetical protein
LDHAVTRREKGEAGRVGRRGRLKGATENRRARFRGSRRGNRKQAVRVHRKRSPARGSARGDRLSTGPSQHKPTQTHDQEGPDSAGTDQGGDIHVCRSGGRADFDTFRTSGQYGRLIRLRVG